MFLNLNIKTVCSSKVEAEPKVFTIRNENWILSHMNGADFGHQIMSKHWKMEYQSTALKQGILKCNLTYFQYL